MKQYHVLVDNNKIGVTAFEKADAPMGVVFGQLIFDNMTLGYTFFKDICLKNGVHFTDYPEDKFITTFNIPNLQVFNSDGDEVKGLSCYVEGMDSDEFDICVIGIVPELYQKEFPHHVAEYYRRLNIITHNPPS
ncbi:MAG: hypothetical protein ACXVAY_04295 [Mucilaginibacter sp.]